MRVFTKLKRFHRICPNCRPALIHERQPADVGQFDVDRRGETTIRQALEGVQFEGNFATFDGIEIN